jgi:WD40 repeat protein
MIPRSLLFLVASAVFTILASAQQNGPACGTAPAILQAAQQNIFSEQQEEWLGEAMADHVEHEYRPLRNAGLNAYLKSIGDGLLAVLPPTKVEFHYVIVDSAEVNGFSLAGGRVYLTNRLVDSARNEDEIAGVIAHEMGHILSHQFAIETSADFKSLLGVTAVTDRADIYAKYQRLVDARMHQKHRIDVDSDDKQDQADRVAVYAAAAAGYRPQAYAEFWDRSFFVGGKTGSHLSDFFGVTTTSQKRLRRIRGIITELPIGCARSKEVVASPTFQRWQHEVLENQAATGIAAASETALAPASSEIQLNPPLRMEIEHLRFSRDGKYILAQDQSSIFVLSREPFKELFRFDAERALAADFTPDSQQIAFVTGGLHVERWSIDDRKLVAAHEIVAQHDCLQVLLAPDARTVVCIGPRDNGELGIALLDVDSGSVLYDLKSWFLPNFNFEFAVLLRRLNNDSSDVLSSSLSADGNLLLIGPGSDRSAFDLRTRTPIKIGGALRSYDYPTSYCFRGNDKVVAMGGMMSGNSGVFSFPEGKRLAEFKFKLPYVAATTGSDLVITSGPPDNPVALADMSTGHYVFGSRSASIDVLGTEVVHEDANGSIALIKLHEDPKNRRLAPLTLSPLAGSVVVSISPDGRYLVSSARTRSSIWDLTTGKQIFLLRGLRYPWWSSTGKLFAELPEVDKDHPRTMSEVTMSPRGVKTVAYKLPEKAHIENGHVLEWKEEKKKNSYTLTASSPEDLSVQWTRSFSDGRPGYTINFADSDLIFSDFLTSPATKEKLRNDPVLKAQADAIKQKAVGRLIEIVDSANGNIRSSVVVEVPLTYEGVDGFNRVGDLLYLSIGDNRTIVYSMKTGAQLRQFFGRVVAADATSGLICAVNRRDEVIVIASSGDEIQHLHLGSPLRFANLREKGTQLLILTADQRVRRFAVSPGVASASR